MAYSTRYYKEKPIQKTKTWTGASSTLRVASATIDENENHPTSDVTGLTWEPMPPMKIMLLIKLNTQFELVSEISVFPRQSQKWKAYKWRIWGRGGNHMVSLSRCPSGSHKGSMETKATTSPHAWCPLTHALQWILFYGNGGNQGFLCFWKNKTVLLVSSKPGLFLKKPLEN